MELFGWAYLGCGGIAHTTARELVDAGAGRIVSAWNRTASKAEAFVADFGGRAYPTAEEAILAPGVEGVYIAVNPNLHAELIRLCVKHRKPVLCEKPFTVNAPEARAVLEEATAQGVYVSEAMWTWHNAVALKVRGWLQAGRIGEVKRVYTCFSPDLRGAARLWDPVMIGGALMDVGVYNLRYCYELFGLPERMECVGQVMQGGVDIRETVLMHYPGFTAENVIGIDQPMEETCVIEGTTGTIRVPLFHMASEAVLEGECTERFEDPSPHYAVQFRQVGEEIRAGRTGGGFVPPRSTLDVMALLDQCREQIGLRYPYEG